MVKEIYSNRSVTLIIKEDCITINYFGTSYSSEYKGDVIDTIAHLLNSLEEKTLNIYAGIKGIINIMEPTPNKTIEFDGTAYIVR